MYYFGFDLVISFISMEQRLARSRCYRLLFVFEHFFYSSAIDNIYSSFGDVNSLMFNYDEYFWLCCV